MEEAYKDADKAREPSVLSKNKNEDEVSIQKSMENLAMEDQDDKKRMINLQRDLPTLLSNIQPASDAEVVRQRTQLEEAQQLREVWIENALKSSEEMSKELERAWSALSEKATDVDQKKILNSQRDLCNTIIEDKYALISDLQQEMKRANKRHVKSLAKNAKELNMMHEKMEGQVKMMTTAYREEMEQTERIHQQEIKILLEKNVAKMEEEIKEFWDKELQELMERRKRVEAAEEKFRQMKIEEAKKENPISRIAEKAREYKQHTKIIVQLKQRNHMMQKQNLKASLAKMKCRMISLETDLRRKKEEFATTEKNFAKKGSKLTQEYKRQLHRYESLQRQIKQFSVTHAKTYEDMYQMIDEELKELAERALTIDSIICKKHLGIDWEPPQMAFLEQTSPAQPQKLPARLSQPQSQAEKCQSPQGEGGNLLNKKQMDVLELLCDEADSLIDPKILKVLALKNKDKQTDVKLHLLCDVLGISEKDIPKLADFLLEYGQQHREKTEDTCDLSSSMAETAEASSVTNSASDLINPDHILPALQSFLEQHKMFRRSSDQHLPSFDLNPEKDVSHWAKLGNIISEDKLKLWDAAERRMKQYQEVLREISDLVPEIERLTQRNKRLRMKLEHRRKAKQEAEDEAGEAF